MFKEKHISCHVLQERSLIIDGDIPLIIAAQCGLVLFTFHKFRTAISLQNVKTVHGCVSIVTACSVVSGLYEWSEVSGDGTAFTWPRGPDPNLCWSYCPPSLQGPKPFEPSPQPPAERAPSAH